MKKIITLLLILFVSTTITKGQNNLIVLNGAYAVLNGGTQTTPIYMVINQNSTSGIIRNGGHINSENQYNFVKWLTNTNTGNYIFPFGVGGNAADYIPFTFNKTSTGSTDITISTWSTNQQNIPHANTTNVAAVTSMTGTADSVASAIDRFWDITSPSPVNADLTFSYRGIENTTAFPTDTAKAQHWNGTSWDTQAGPGNLGVTTGIGSVGPIPNQTTFSPWILTIIPTVVCPNASFTYAAPFCAGDTSSILPTIAVNGITGVFSATPIGLVFTDTLTGKLNIAASTPGTYMIYNSLSATGGCPAKVDSFQIVINTYPTGTTTVSICQGDSMLLGGAYQTLAGNYVDTLLAASFNGCDSILTTTLTIPALPTGTTTVSICQGDSILLGGAYQTLAGNYIDTLLAASFNGCDSILTTTLTIPALPTGTTTATICQGDSILLGGAYQTLAGNYVDTLLAASFNGCDSILTTTLTIPALPTGTTTATICQGDSMLLGGAYQTLAGNYIDTLLAASFNGCDSILTTTLTLVAPPVASIAGLDSICQGSSLILTASGGGTYLWNTSETTSAININPISSATYSVIVSIGTCADTANFMVVVNPIPTINAGNDVTINLGTNTTLNATGTNGTYTWNPPTWLSCVICPTTTSTPDETITYTVTVVDSNGCSATDSVMVIVDYNNVVFVPNIFSPNGDGNNDILYVRGQGIASFQFVLYDRWGEDIFETTDLNKGWNGVFRGKAMNKAVFVYYLKGFFKDGSEFNQKGDVTLMR